jgi:hypothetical protein
VQKKRVEKEGANCSAFQPLRFCISAQVEALHKFSIYYDLCDYNLNSIFVSVRTGMLRIGIHIGGRMVVGTRSNVVQGCMVAVTQQQVRIGRTAAQHGGKEQDLK